MIRDDICWLVAETPAAHGIFDKPAETERMVYCAVRSVGREEFYRALANNLHPSVVFVLQDAIEYQGEKIVLWQPRGAAERKRYRVVRTYQGTGYGHDENPNALEIYCEEATVDA